MMNIMNMRRHAGEPSSQHSEVPASLEAEQFLAAVIAATPSAMLRPETCWAPGGSSNSVNSLGEGLGNLATPTLSR